MHQRYESVFIHKNNFRRFFAFCKVAIHSLDIPSIYRRLLCTLEALLEFRQQPSCCLLKLGSCARKPQTSRCKPSCWKWWHDFFGVMKGFIMDNKTWFYFNVALLDMTRNHLMLQMSKCHEMLWFILFILFTNFILDFISNSIQSIPQNYWPPPKWLQIGRPWMIIHNNHGPQIGLGFLVSVQRYHQVESPHAERSDPSKTDTAKVSRSCATEPRFSTRWKRSCCWWAPTRYK